MVALKVRHSLFAYWVAVKVNGGSHVLVTLADLVNGDSSQSKGGLAFMSVFDGTTPEYPPLNDVLQSHLVSCGICQSSLEKKPVGIGGTPNLCSEWFSILEKFAQMEGELNNVVSHDEYGNEANTRPEVA